MAVAINLITNPRAAVNTTGWSATGGTLSRDTTVVPPGGGSPACFKVVATATGTMSLNYTVTGLTVGQRYALSFYVKTNSAVADFSVVPSVTGVVTADLPTLKSGEDFQRRHIGFIATASSHVIRAITEAPVLTGDTMWVDRVMLNAAGNFLLPYFDGSYPYSSWSGTAFASTSLNTVFDTGSAGTITTDEVVVVNGLCLNTLGWNITSKAGRYTPPSFRGDDYTTPGQSGKQFAANKPIDSGLFTLSMFVLGAYPDGTVPSNAGMRVVFENNLRRILRQCVDASNPVTIYTWQPNGSVLTTQATLAGSSAPDISPTMGGRRAELTLAFEVLPGIWSDYFATTVTGTPSASWSSQNLLLTALDGGTAPIDDSVVTVTGPITNPTVSNAATGTSVTYAGTVIAGQSWEIDSGAWTSKVNGVSVLTSTSHVGHPRFLVIDPGNLLTVPTIHLTGTGTTSATNLAVTAKRKHMIG